MRGNSPIVVLAAFVAVAVAVGLVITFVRGESDTRAPRQAGQPGTANTTASTTPRTTPTTTPPSGPSATVVKVDNTAAARPQTGIGSADLVYVEPVEGGLTRLAAVYFGEPPAAVGPVRSARQTDVQLLAQLGTPTLAYSGVAPELAPMLHDAPVRPAAPEQNPGPYYRSGRAVPHNLYVNGTALPDPAAPARQKVVPRGSIPDGGTSVDGHSVHYHSASLSFFWSADAGRWLVSMDGVPMTSTESGRLTAGSVVVQRVPVGDGVHVEDTSGAVSPVATTVGSGPATVLRDGTKFTGTWSRQDADAATRYRTTSGQSLPLAHGPVWVLLVPR